MNCCKNNSIITIEGFSCKVRVITRNDIKIAEKKNPSGKPFVELNGYIHEVEGAISSLQDQINTLFNNSQLFFD